MEKFDKLTKYVLGISTISFGGIGIYHQICNGLNYSILIDLAFVLIGFCIFKIKD